MKEKLPKKNTVYMVRRDSGEYLEILVTKHRESVSYGVNVLGERMAFYHYKFRYEFETVLMDDNSYTNLQKRFLSFPGNFGPV